MDDEDNDFALNLVVPSALSVPKPKPVASTKSAVNIPLIPTRSILLPKNNKNSNSSSENPSILQNYSNPSSSSSLPKPNNNTLSNSNGNNYISPLNAEAIALSSTSTSTPSVHHHTSPSGNNHNEATQHTSVVPTWTRKNPKKTEATKTPVIVPVNPHHSSHIPYTASINSTLSSSPNRLINTNAVLPTSATTVADSYSGLMRYQIIPYTLSPNDETTFSSTSAVSPAAIFSSLGLDDRLVQKLVSNKTSSSATTTTTTLNNHNNNSSSEPNHHHHIAASSGILRGHLRDGFGLTKPTRVQYYMIPLAIQSKSLLVRSETGSGKTLAFLLPVIHHLLQQYNPSSIDMMNTNTNAHSNLSSSSSSNPSSLKSTNTIPLSRSEGGTKVVIVSPTRELCAQIFTVLTRLVQPFPYLIPSLLAGGEKRKSEKARLRKGCTIVVATPGRLLDHLRTTESFVCNLATVQYLILDEADRLLDMGFKIQIQDIMQLLRTRNNNNNNNNNNGKMSTNNQGSRSISHRSTDKQPKNTQHPVTFLLSATVSTAVKELAQEVLFDNAIYIDATLSGNARIALNNSAALKSASGTGNKDTNEENDDQSNEFNKGNNNNTSSEHNSSISHTNDVTEDTTVTVPTTALITYSAPKTLQQTAMIVPLKWRLVTLLAILYQAARRGQHKARTNPNVASTTTNVPNGIQCKGILFVSTTDGVDFYHAIFSQLLPRLLFSSKKSRSNNDTDDTSTKVDTSSVPNNLSSLFPVYRLHGNIPQTERTSVFRTFSAANAGLLIATDVAARGLDLPAIDLIIQADAPSETEDYVHRIGRTARRGQKGSSMLILQPHEAPYLDLLRAAGLEVTQMDTTAALATLSDAEPPFDIVKGDTNGNPNAYTGMKNSSASYKLTDSSKSRSTNNRSGSTLPFDPDFLDMSVDDAEAMVYSQKMVAANNKDKETNGKDFRDPNERDPVTGLTVRLSNLFKYARQARSNQYNTSVSNVFGGSNNGKNESISHTGNPIERVAETYAVAWQCFIEEFVLLGLPLSKTNGISQRETLPNEKRETLEYHDEDNEETTMASTVLKKRIPLLPLARSAFLSFVRAYSTHEKKVRHIFHPRLLHLGHAAKAFGLREQPSIASRASRQDSNTVIESALHYDDEDKGVSDVDDNHEGTNDRNKGNTNKRNSSSTALSFTTKKNPKEKKSTTASYSQSSYLTSSSSSKPTKNNNSTVLSRYDVRKQTNDDREASKLHFTSLNTNDNLDEDGGEPVKKRSKKVAQSMSEFDA